MKKNTSTVIARYLFSYRNTPYCLTDQTHSSQIRFEFLTSIESQKAKERQLKFYKGNRFFNTEVGEQVYALDYRSDQIVK